MSIMSFMSIMSLLAEVTFLKFFNGDIRSLVAVGSLDRKLVS